MIYFYSGTPGSGKSLHVAQDIIDWLVYKKKRVIANFEINRNIINKGFFRRSSKNGDNFHYISNNKLNVKSLVSFAEKNHVRGKEAQTLLIIDECQLIFNPREFSRADRLEWNHFFTQHRKLGYEVILISQMDRLVDRQIRGLFEYEIKHRKVNNFKFGCFFPFATFCAVTYWYGVRERLGCSFFFYKRKLGDLYDSYKMFEEE